MKRTRYHRCGQAVDVERVWDGLVFHTLYSINGEEASQCTCGEQLSDDLLAADEGRDETTEALERMLEDYDKRPLRKKGMSRD